MEEQGSLFYSGTELLLWDAGCRSAGLLRCLPESGDGSPPSQLWAGGRGRGWQWRSGQRAIFDTSLLNRGLLEANTALLVAKNNLRFCTAGRAPFGASNQEEELLGQAHLVSLGFGSFLGSNDQLRFVLISAGVGEKAAFSRLCCKPAFPASILCTTSLLWRGVTHCPGAQGCDVTASHEHRDITSGFTPDEGTIAVAASCHSLLLLRGVFSERVQSH